MNKNARILAILVVFFCSSITWASDDELKSVKAFVAECFRTYIIGLDKNRDAALTVLKKQCLTPQFAKDWVKRRRLVDADPFLQAQDTGEAWQTQIRVDNLNLQAKKAQVFLGKDGDIACLKLTLKQVSSNWKIDSTTECTKNQL